MSSASHLPERLRSLTPWGFAVRHRPLRTAAGAAPAAALGAADKADTRRARETPVRFAGDEPARRSARVERSRGQPLSNATASQRRIALVACLAMLAVTALLLPFARETVGTIPAFFAIQQTVMIGSCLVSACLLSAHFEAVGVVGLLQLGAGFVYAAFVLALQLLSAEGVFLDGARLAGGPQTTLWLWVLWHLAPALSVMHVARTAGRRDVDAARRKADLVRTALVLGGAAVGTALLVVGAERALPVVDVRGDIGALVTTGLAPALEVLIAAALVALWRASRFRNALHAWLAVTVVALFCDNALTMAGGDRASLGWHAGGLLATAGLSVLTVVYLWDIRASYAQSVQLADQLAFSNSELDAQAQENRLQVQDLLTADLRKDEFLVMLAHELRNPLAPMRSAAHLLSIAPGNGELVRRTSEVLTRQVRQMSSLVEDLLDASRLSMGHAELQEVELDAKDVLCQSVEQARAVIDERAHALAVDLPDDRVVVAGDLRRLVQVFTNLLVNAAKYTPRGGRLHVRLEATPREVVVRVRDNGIGMSPELLGRAFLLFAQGAPSVHKPQGGLGIGLALVKSLVELHRGTVQASSDGEGLGTEIVVRLPRVQSA